MSTDSVLCLTYDVFLKQGYSVAISETGDVEFRIHSRRFKYVRVMRFLTFPGTGLTLANSSFNRLTFRLCVVSSSTSPSKEGYACFSGACTFVSKIRWRNDFFKRGSSPLEGASWILFEICMHDDIARIITYKLGPRVDSGSKGVPRKLSTLPRHADSDPRVGLSLSTIVLNSRDWSEIVWLPEISRFKNQPCNRLYLKKTCWNALVRL